MKDVIIKIDQNSMVYKQDTVLGISYENLQGKLIFKFLGTFPDGTAYLEYERGTEKGYIPMNKVEETYEVEIKSSLLTKEGRIYLQLRVTENSKPEGIPIFKSNKFYLEVKEAINATTEIPDEYPEWIDTANEKIKEIDNINITTERVEDGVNINVTGKDGKTTTTEVKDGAPGPKGERGEPGAVKMQVVDTLPDTGETDTIYLLKKEKPGVQNLYDEYVYTDSGWEHIGDTSVDLSDYYTKEESDEKFTYTAGDNITISEDNVISASSDGKPCYVIKYTENVDFSTLNDNAYTIASVKTPIENAINDAYRKSYTYIAFHISKDEANGTGNLVFNRQSANIQDKPTFIRFNTEVISGSSPYNKINNVEMRIGGAWDNNVFTISYVYFGGHPQTLAKLDAVLTKTNTTSYTPTGDYNPATKKYVDDLNPPYYTMSFYWDKIALSGSASESVTDSEILGKFSTCINNIYNRTDKMGFLLLYNCDSLGRVFKATGGLACTTQTTRYYTKCLLQECNPTSNKYNNADYSTFNITVDGEWENNIFTASRIYISRNGVGSFDFTYKYVTYSGSNPYVTNTQVLTKSNTTEYTPTKDYHPATKKYVDDKITPSAITYIVPEDQMYTFKLDQIYSEDTENELLKCFVQAYKLFEDSETLIPVRIRTDNGTYEYYLDQGYGITETSKRFRCNDLYAQSSNDYMLSNLYVELHGTTTDNVFTTTSIGSGTIANTVMQPIGPNYITLALTDLMSGYDASKTQVLKNINGTLTWVDET